MTGVEAVSTVPGSPARAKNASATLVAMATLAIVMFVGIRAGPHLQGRAEQRRNPASRNWAVRFSAGPISSTTFCRRGPP
jgi:hypothetical protein